MDPQLEVFSSAKVEEKINEFKNLNSKLDFKFDKLEKSILDIREKNQKYIQSVTVMESIICSLELLLEEYKSAANDAAKIFEVINRLEDDLSIAQALNSFNRVISDKRNIINEIRKGLIDLQKLILETRKVEMKESQLNSDESIEKEIIEGFDVL